MGGYDDEIVPWEAELRERQFPKTVMGIKSLGTPALDLDARTLALLGKRQKLRVRSSTTTFDAPIKDTDSSGDSGTLEEYL